MSFEIEPRQILYNRTGILSDTASLNRGIAEQFMRVSDLRRDIVIIDSDKKPERSTVAVGSDVLAWRSIVPLGELTKIVFRPQKFHQVELVEDQYQILIHDQIIDDDLRKSCQDRQDYEIRFLARLNSSVKGGMAEALLWEKVGFRDQYPNWMLYIGGAPSFASFLALGEFKAATIILGFIVICGHLVCSAFSNSRFQLYKRLSGRFREFIPGFQLDLPPYINPRGWKEAILPTVPVDKWIKGRRLLAKHGDELITMLS